MKKIYLYYFIFLIAVSSGQPCHAQTKPEQHNFKKWIAKTQKSIHKNSSAYRIAALKKLPMNAQFYVWNGTGDSWTLSSTSKYTYDRSGNKLSGVSLNPAGDTLNAQYYTYDSRGYLIDNITRETNGIQLVNQYRYTTEVDQKGNETVHLSYNWDNDKWALESGRKSVFTYDGLGRVLQEIIQICSMDEVWTNSAKNSYTYSGNSEVYSGVVGSSWRDGAWQKFFDTRDMVWRDFSKDIVVSANQFEYEDGIIAYTSRISSVMNGSTLIELYEELIDGVWTPIERISHSTNMKGDEILLVEEYEDGSWMPIDRETEYKDEKGEYAGYKIETYENGRWSLEDSYIHIHTYNANSERTETITESNGAGGFNRSRTTYSNFVEVDVTGTSSPQALALLSAYPNPAKDEITLTGLLGTLDVAVMSVTNQVVMTQTIAAGAETIHISHLPAGLYYIKLSSPAGAVKTLKLIKQ